MAEKWMKISAERYTVSEQLENLRQQYSVAKSEKKTELATKILPLEQKYEKLVAEIHSLEKEIRTFEQR
jgi:chromosome segregation ATPase